MQMSFIQKEKKEDKFWGMTLSGNPVDDLFWATGTSPFYGQVLSSGVSPSSNASPSFGVPS